MSELLGSGAGGPTTIDVTAADFEQAVVEESMSRPVIVDLWGPSCGPCRTLGPVLEKVVAEMGGRVLLAKINVEVEQQLAAAFGVSSIPAVIAIDQGRPVDQFVGALPEEQVREWVSRLAPSVADQLVREAETLEATDPERAVAMYREALTDPKAPDAAKVGLAYTLTQVGQRDEAKRLIEELEARGYLEPKAEQAKSILELPVADDEAVALARSAADAAPEDLTKQVALAEALAGASRDEDALKVAIEVVRKDRDGVGQDAKAVMLRVFDKLGGGPLVSEYRRTLSTLLY